jgi:hypothetical protein
MLNLSPVRSVAREARSWGYAVQYGPFNLEYTIAKNEGTKPVSVLGTVDEVGIGYVTVENRAKTGAGRRIIVSAWTSFPVNVKSKSETRRSMMRASRVLRRLVARKMERYVRECEA